MSRYFGKLKDYLYGYSNCSTPEPEPTPSENSKKEEAEPIIFDEMENPALIEQMRKHPLRPSSFEALVQPLKMATMVEPLEGFKCDFGIGLSPHLSIQNSITLNQGPGGNYEANFMYVGGQMANAYDYISPSPFLMARVTPGSGKQDIKAIFKGENDMEYRLTANYMPEYQKDGQVMLEVDKSGEDYVAGFKFGIAGELFSYHYTQSLTKNLVAGIDVMSMLKPRSVVLFSYGGKYTFGSTSYYFQHFAPAGIYQFGALIKSTNNITYTTELNYSKMGQENFEFVGGISIRFSRAKMNAQFKSSGVVSAVLTQVINPIIRISLHSEMDLAKGGQKFGIGVAVGQ
ncbi:unnamed protein product [Blepharisma stoltei]|uniref:Uncharacterized protein n=1 Tax=Blepharisma stoltei TaxID=1481888 RepID=A0AAU9IM15_9CILI|nr:unnamed protein product [Blepharisma stoltei]